MLDFIREAHAAGVKMFACAMALGEHRRGDLLVAQAEGVADAATVIGNAAAGHTRTLVF